MLFASLGAVVAKENLNAKSEALMLSPSKAGPVRSDSVSFLVLELRFCAGH